MISINTNKSSIITQSNLTQSSQSLKQSIERMTTGLKINNAKDNAATYSISTNMTTKIGAYGVAESNASMGLDMLLTAQNSLEGISEGLSRLRALAVQAQNGTYGGQSLDAINSEADSIVQSINQLFHSAQYNGVKLLDAYTVDIPENGTQTEMPKAEHNGFIENAVTYTKAEVDAMQKVKDVNTFVSGQTYSISSDAEMKKLADYVNSGQDTTGVTFVLGDDIDLSAYSSGTGWTPIGNYSASTAYIFKGTFDGNGHTISGLKIDNSTVHYQGLFGYAQGGKIKNVGIDGAEIIGKQWTASLVGYTKSDIENCYSTGNISSIGSCNCVGGLIGRAENNTVSSCYSEGNINSSHYTGGLIGQCFSSTITDCYSTANITSNAHNIGGLVGNAGYSTIISSYATGDVSGVYNLSLSVGGLVGGGYGTSFTSCYATGDVYGGSTTGGLVGSAGAKKIINCYATGDVEGLKCVGGLIGGIGNSNISGSYATGSVTGKEWVGGLVGQAQQTNGTGSIEDCISYSAVSGTKYTGSFIGGVINTNNGSTYGTINISNSETISTDMDKIGGCYQQSGSTYIPNTKGLSAMLAGISFVVPKSTTTSLQIGIHGNEASEISFQIGLKYGLIDRLNGISIEDASTLSTIDEIVDVVSERQTSLGSISNRLESVLEEIDTQYGNLVSSRSTLRDTDIAQESSAYIRSQILQQASATLLSSANQTPTIAITLLQSLWV